MAIDFKKMRDDLAAFDFRRLFIEELGWSRPPTLAGSQVKIKDHAATLMPIAQLAGVAVFEVSGFDGRIPDAKVRALTHKEVAKLHHENLLIFVDADRTQSLWYWVKRQDGKSQPREHYYMKGQPGDLFISKISGIVFDISEFDESGDVSIVEVSHRLRHALDVERVTKQFFADFKTQHTVFLDLIEGIADERQRRWYASVLLNRLMFIYFLQRKFFLDNGDGDYLQHKLAWSKKQGPDRFFKNFLSMLFFEGFAKPREKRSAEAHKILGDIRYLNGGLFLRHTVEEQNPDIRVPDKAFENLFGLFEQYSWNLNDTPGGNDRELNPDVLGYIFEKYINQKAFGAYYTRPEITEYLCDRTIHRLILDAVNTPSDAPVLQGVKRREYESVAELLMDLDAPLCDKLIKTVLPNLSLLDPACGSGAFLVAAMRTLIDVYSAVIGKIKFLSNRELSRWLGEIEGQHKSVGYFIKKRIITDNLYGVDLMEEASEIARLRLFLALVASADTVDQLEPLPNIDFNILHGNSLVGLMRVEDKDFERRTKQGKLFRKSYKEILEEKNRLIDNFRHTAGYAADLTSLRDNIDEKNREAQDTLNDILLEQFRSHKILFEQAVWDEKKGEEGKPIKRPLTAGDIQALHPFHWGYQFDKVLNDRGGFDAIITNPPWEIVKPIAKEFCYDFDPAVERRGTAIKDFEERLASLLKKPDARARYLEYASRFPHVSAYFRNSPEYRNQIAMVDGRKAGSDINLYKLFVERCFNLLRPGGLCGIVLPSGIYTDLGAKQLRELLFAESQVTGLFAFENRKGIFEGVDSRFKFVVLTFQRGGKTDYFPAAFMRLDVKDLERFPRQMSTEISVDLVRRLAPDSLSIMEFNCQMDIDIATKMLRFPHLGEQIDGLWNLRFAREFDMTNDSRLFKAAAGKDRLPLYEGKMIWHFAHGLVQPRYWIDEADARRKLRSPRLKAIGKLLEENGTTEFSEPKDVPLGYENYRLGFRAVTGATNERALVVTVIPRRVCAGNSLIVSMPTIDTVRNGAYHPVPAYSPAELLVAVSFMSSFVCDWFIRQKILTNMNMFYVYQIPVPRLKPDEAAFGPILNRGAKLTATTEAFDDLARAAGLKGYRDAVTEASRRPRIQAELDGLIAHAYGLTEDEFAHILSTFPIVPDPVKVAARNAYRDVARGLIK